MDRSTQRSGFGDWLRHRRHQSGLTQSELAERAGLTPNAIAALERGRRTHPHAHTVRALVAALYVSPAEHGEVMALLETPAAAMSPFHATPPSLHDAPTTLIGWQGKVSRILARLDEDPLVTLTGPGGVGKTTLALAVARRAGTSFPDGVVVVALETLDDPALVPAWIAATARDPAGWGGGRSSQSPSCLDWRWEPAP